MEIQPIPFYYDSINRNAIVVKPKRPFFDWVNGIDEDTLSIEEKYENNIYLVREHDSNEDTLNWLKKNFHGIADIKGNTYDQMNEVLWNNFLNLIN